MSEKQLTFPFVLPDNVHTIIYDDETYDFYTSNDELLYTIFRQKPISITDLPSDVFNEYFENDK